MVSLKKLKQTLLDTIVSNFRYFREHPSHLAWVVMNYGLIDDVGDQSQFVEIDPNDVSPHQRTYERLNSEQDVNLLGAAFDLIHQSYGGFPDSNPNVPLQLKPNKTLDDWIALLTGSGDFDYWTHTREQVLSDLLYENHSTYYRWNNEGFLMRVGWSGVEYRVFFGYTRVENEVPEQIRRKVRKVMENPKIKEAISALQKQYDGQRQRIYSGATWKEVFDPEWFEMEKLKSPESVPKEQEKKRRFALFSDSNLVIAPTNAHLSYLMAGEEISDRILSDTSSDPISRQLAQKFQKKLDSGYFQRS